MPFFVSVALSTEGFIFYPVAVVAVTTVIVVVAVVVVTLSVAK